MVQTAFGEKVRTPSVLGWPPLPVHEPVHTAGSLAHAPIVVSGGADSEHVPVLPGPQLTGDVMLPWPRMFRRSVT